jgi:hypothetical protein
VGVGEVVDPLIHIASQGHCAKSASMQKLQQLTGSDRDIFCMHAMMSTIRVVGFTASSIPHRIT